MIVTFSTIIALLVGLVLGVLLSFDLALAALRESQQKPVWPSVIQVTPKPTRSEMRRLRRARRELGNSLSDRVN